MRELLPIGSIVEMNETEFVILGYHLLENDAYIPMYLLGEYPIGFLTYEEIIAIPIDAEMRCVYRGYEDATSKLYLKKKLKAYDFLKGENVDEMGEIMTTIHTILSERVIESGE